RFGVPNQRVSRWFSPSPDVPRSSAIGPPVPSPLAGRVGRGHGLDCRRLVLGLATAATLCDQRVDLLVGQVVEVLVGEAHHRRVLAGAEALALVEAEEAVARHLARIVYADVLAQVLDDAVRAAQHAAEVRAHVEAVLADRPEVE